MDLGRPRRHSACPFNLGRKLGGLVVVGEPFWRRIPSPEHLEASALNRSRFDTHDGNARTGLGLGLGLLHAIVSSRDDWDRYVGYQWLAAERYASRNQDDPDVPELMARTRQARDHYLQWGRDEILGRRHFLKDPHGSVGG